jgi:hypothetical protein
VTSFITFHCYTCLYLLKYRVIWFKATFNSISVIIISWRSVLFVEETRVPGENHQPYIKTLTNLYHIILYWEFEYISPWLAWAGFELTTLMVIGTDCIGSCKSNYNTITATTASLRYTLLCIVVGLLSFVIF